VSPGGEGDGIGRFGDVRPVGLCRGMRIVVSTRCHLQQGEFSGLVETKPCATSLDVDA
jgi:hypothetical protein